ncbi:GvpL/GvpF family gas vesicle protein [Streptomyces sp. Act-28]
MSPVAVELPPSDAELVQRMRGGDDSAYEELFRRHAGAVRRYARTCCRDRHTADDLTAEVFARTLQAVRRGAGPEQAVRAYLLTTVRHVAAAWTRTARREQLVEDFGAFAAGAAWGSEAAGGDAVEPGADVRALQEAEQSLAVRAFRSLPERWQAVLWHTAVEEESPREVAPLFGLTANATAVLASRAREGLRQAYLQAHVNEALMAGGDCARYADRLGAYAEAAAVHPPQDPRLAGDTDGVNVLNAAYLVARERAEGFVSLVGGASEEEDVRVELTGPWAPYSFAGIAEEDAA